LARLHEVPVLVRPLSDTEAMAAGLVENLQRTDLNPVEEAMGYQRLLQEFQMTQEKLAEAIGKSRAHIGNVLRLLTLPESVLALLRKGSLSFGHARALLTHPDPAALAARVARENLSVRELERLASAKPMSEPSAAARPEHDAETAALERALSEKLGLNVRITFNGRSGSLTVSYRSLDQLDELLTLLNA
jgi:ParB family chromosome partitioning protein